MEYIYKEYSSPERLLWKRGQVNSLDFGKGYNVYERAGHRLILRVKPLSWQGVGLLWTWFVRT